MKRDRLKPKPPESQIVIHVCAKFSIQELAALPPNNVKALMQGIAAITSADSLQTQEGQSK